MRRYGAVRESSGVLALLSQHLYPYSAFTPQVASAAACFLPALVFYANKEERQP